MRIAAVRATPVNIPFHAPYRFSLGSTASVTKTIVEVETVDGLTGHRRVRRRRSQCRGRASRRAPDRARPARPQRVRAALRAGVRALAVGERDDAQARVRRRSRWRSGIARGRAEDKPLHVLLGGAVRREIAFTEYFSLRHPGAAHPGESTPLEVARYCARMIEEYDSPTFEGKLATVGLEEELEMVREVRAAIGDRPLRLDANHAWTVPTARDVLRRLAPYDIRCIEEPVGSHEELARLRPFTRHRVLGARARPAARRRARRARLLRAQHRRARRHPPHRRVRARLRACSASASGSTPATPASRARPTCSCRPRWSRSASPARRSSTGTPTTSSPRGRSARGAASCPSRRAPGLGVTLDAGALARCHERFLAEGAFPSGEAGAPERTQGSFGALKRS